MTADVLEDALGSLPVFGLEVLAELPLHRHFDRKHLLRVAELPRLVEELGAGTSVLEVGARRAVDYTSVYFDTPDLATYHDHRQGRRRRFKIRTRHYGEPAGALLEVKAKGLRGRTVKHRTPHPGPSPRDLDEEARRFITEVLAELYGMPAPAPLVPVLTTRFVRTTLLTDDGDRVTVDRDFHVVDGERELWFDRDWAVVESKSDVRHPAAGTALRRLGAKSDPVSKYCLGVAALHPGLPSNRWRRAQRLLGPEADRHLPTST